MLKFELLSRLKWMRLTDYVSLIGCIKRDDVGLGIFSNTANTACVIPDQVCHAFHADRLLNRRELPAIRKWPRTLPAEGPTPFFRGFAGIARRLSRAKPQVPPLGRNDSHDSLGERATPRPISAKLLDTLICCQRVYEGNTEIANRRMSQRHDPRTAAHRLQCP